jgi:hypothetical protein
MYGIIFYSSTDRQKIIPNLPQCRHPAAMAIASGNRLDLILILGARRSADRQGIARVATIRCRVARDRPAGGWLPAVMAYPAAP